MLLKASSKRRRSKAELLAAKAEEVDRLKQEVEKDKEIQRLRDQLEVSKHKEFELQSSKNIVDQMLQHGQARINSEGAFELLS